MAVKEIEVHTRQMIDWRKWQRGKRERSGSRGREQLGKKNGNVGVAISTKGGRGGFCPYYGNYSRWTAILTKL